MKEIKFISGNITKTMYMDKIKIIKGNDYRFKYMLYQIIRASFNKKSEYQEEYSKKSFLIDNQVYRCTNAQLFDVHPYFNLDDDLKMGTKSLAYRYVDSLLKTNMYFDSITTVDIVLQSLKNQLNDNEGDVQFDINEFNNQVLIKMIKPSFNKEDYKVNMYDFDYETMILKQLNMIESIVNKSETHEFIILLNIHIVTETILEKLNCINCDLIFVFTSLNCEVKNLNMMYFAENGGFDFMDINRMYEIICEKTGNLWTEEELKMNLIKYFNEEWNENTRLIHQQLKHI